MSLVARLNRIVVLSLLTLGAAAQTSKASDSGTFLKDLVHESAVKGTEYSTLTFGEKKRLFSTFKPAEYVGGKVEVVQVDFEPQVPTSIYQHPMADTLIILSGQAPRGYQFKFASFDPGEHGYKLEQYSGELSEIKNFNQHEQCVLNRLGASLPALRRVVLNPDVASALASRLGIREVRLLYRIYDHKKTVTDEVALVDVHNKTVFGQVLIVGHTDQNTDCGRKLNFEAWFNAVFAQPDFLDRMIKNATFFGYVDVQAKK